MKARKIFLFALVLFFLNCEFPLSVFSQGVGINSTGAAPDASAMLDVVASARGLLIPRVSLISNTDVATIASPATSLLVYNTNASMTNGNGTGFYYWNGTVWLPIGYTSNSGGPCQVSAITNELDGAGAPCAGTACGAAMSLLSCSTFCANLSYNGYTDWAMPDLGDVMSLLTIAPGNTSANVTWLCSFGVIGNGYGGYDFSTGNNLYTIYSSTYYCRCVR